MLLATILQNAANLTEKNRYAQAMMTAGYELWQEGDKSYGDVIDELGTIDRVIQFVMLAGNFNYQVENGGHFQYLHNGYAGGDFGCFATRNITDRENHDLMIRLFDELNLKVLPHGETVYKIWKQFDLEYAEVECEGCGGQGSWIEVGDDGEEEECYCDECHGTGISDEGGEVTPGYCDHLDTQYYEINDAWLNALDQYCRIYLESQVVSHVSLKSIFSFVRADSENYSDKYLVA